MSWEENRRQRKIKWSKWLDGMAPPGIGTDGEIGYFVSGLIFALFMSLEFFFNYNEAYSEFYDQIDSVGYVVDFTEVLGGSLDWFYLYSIIVLCMVIRYYLYYRKDSKSIYLMKRLPNRFELHKRAWALPLLGMLVTLLAAFVVLVIYFVIYMTVIPKGFIAPEQWQKIWR